MPESIPAACRSTSERVTSRALWGCVTFFNDTLKVSWHLSNTRTWPKCSHSGLNRKPSFSAQSNTDWATTISIDFAFSLIYQIFFHEAGVTIFHCLLSQTHSDDWDQSGFLYDFVHDGLFRTARSSLLAKEHSLIRKGNLVFVFRNM